MNTASWETAGQLVAWLDEHSAATTPEVTRLLRVLKIQEEAGEVAEALHGVMGSNPRKGASHDWADVEKELCDVILTAMVALATVSDRAEEVFQHHLARVAARSLDASAVDRPHPLPRRGDPDRVTGAGGRHDLGGH
ncbi:MazG-like family protein [Streptomyces profundus]|uniref:MazG-like family protein n=1 Tax=Streptomyces profundus TaxID=2867410 RepID=UPI001D164B92|nr:MazG-like family protein [Streptomyces sp. MA3_2.13]UED84197.1 MazG-like family protein [Streptomyces sp. MA3_2.13]